MLTAVALAAALGFQAGRGPAKRSGRGRTPVTAAGEDTHAGGPLSARQGETPVVPTLSPPLASAALARLGTLSDGDRAPREGYRRDAFGPRWADVDRNGCDTRNDILRRDLADAETKPGSRGCVVTSGRLLDPYTGVELAFDKARAAEVQIDHVVSLSNAWQTGAQSLSPEARTSLANDPLNLLAVDGPTNETKGDGDAAEWLTPNPAFRCELVARQVEVKARYGLWVTRAERAAMERVLETCIRF